MRDDQLMVCVVHTRTRGQKGISCTTGRTLIWTRQHRFPLSHQNKMKNTSWVRVSNPAPTPAPTRVSLGRISWGRKRINTGVKTDHVQCATGATRTHTRTRTHAHTGKRRRRRRRHTVTNTFSDSHHKEEDLVIHRPVTSSPDCLTYRREETLRVY